MLEPYEDFTTRLETLIAKQPELIITTLSNVFTMRLLGNKTHGDLAEVAIAEFVNQFMYDFRALHVGKDLFRSKDREEDILLINVITGVEIPVSLKAYGDGPLQLSTDRTFAMFPLLERHTSPIDDAGLIADIFAHAGFGHFGEVNVLPLIYNEVQQKCNIMVFNAKLAKARTAVIQKVLVGRGRLHPVYRFLDSEGSYICEVRYGGAASNALQRGLWTHTRNALPYFKSVTRGWIDYSHNLVLIDLFAKALNATTTGHQNALDKINEDLAEIRRRAHLAG